MPFFAVKAELSWWLTELKEGQGKSRVWESLWPAHGDTGDERGVWCRAKRKVADIEVGQWVLCIATHGAIYTVHVLVNHSWDELRCEGDDECLKHKHELKLQHFYDTSSVYWTVKP